VTDAEEETKVREQLFVSGLLSGHASPRSWFGKSEPTTFYHGKGIVESLVKQLATIRVSYEQPKHSRLFHPNRSATIKLGLREVGTVGEVHPFIRGQILQTDEPVILFEMSLDALRKYERAAVKFKPPSKFPSVEVDLAVLVDKPHSSYSLAEAIRHAGGSLLADVAIFDLYEGEQVPAEKKSIGFRLTFSSHDRTLQDTEILPLKENIVKNLSERYGAQLR
jgi:phenylalanyl-tRNA synthetase beta chain